MKNLRIAFLVALAADLGLIVWSFGRLGPLVPVHWNLRGEVDRLGSPGELRWFLFGTIVFLWLVGEGLRFVDPKVARTARDPELSEKDKQGALAMVLGTIAGLLVVLHANLLSQAAGMVAPAPRATALILAAFLVVLGNVLPRVRPNYFVGIRTPWTLSSDEVWRTTHRMGGRWMVGSGLLGALAAIVLPPSAVLPAVLILAVLAAALSVGFSYLAWRRSGL